MSAPQPDECHGGVPTGGSRQDGQGEGCAAAQDGTGDAGKLAAELRVVSENLTAYIHAAAEEIALPQVAAAQAEADRRVAEVQGNYAFEAQRWAEMEREFRRQLRVLRRRLGDRDDDNPEVVHGPGRVAAELGNAQQSVIDAARRWREVTRLIEELADGGISRPSRALAAAVDELVRIEGQR